MNPNGRISFDARNGATIADVEISDSMTLPTNPTWGDNAEKNNYTFAGWYDAIDGNGGNQIIDKNGNFGGTKPTGKYNVICKMAKYHRQHRSHREHKLEKSRRGF